MCNAWNARLRFSNWASICMWIETSDCFYLMLFCPFLFLLCAISTWDCAFLFSFWPLLTWYPGLIHSRWFVALCKIDICPSSCVKQHVYNNKDSLLKIVSLSCMYMSWWCHWSHTRCSGLFCRCDPRNSASNPLKWYFRSQMPQKTSKYSTRHTAYSILSLHQPVTKGNGNNPLYKHAQTVSRLYICCYLLWNQAS